MSKKKLEDFLEVNKKIVQEFFELKNAAIFEENIALEGKWFKASEKISDLTFVFVIKVRKCKTLAFTLDVTKNSIEYNERECSELKRLEVASLTEAVHRLKEIERKIEMVKSLDIASMKSDLKVS